MEFLLRIGVIKKSKSNITSPIVLVRKPDKSWRMCIDLRWVNSHTTTMRWPLPKLKEILPYLNESKFFASLDLLRGFWQFPISEESQRFWSFVTHHGQFQFTRVVMGGKNSAGYFQQVMQKVLADLLFLCVLIYIDDVLIFAKTEEQFIQAIGAVFEQLRVHRIYLKPQNAPSMLSDSCGADISWMQQEWQLILRLLQRSEDYRDQRTRPSFGNLSHPVTG